MEKTNRMNQVSAKKMLIRTAMIFLVPFFVFLMGLFIYSGSIYKERQIQNSQERISMYLSGLEGDLTSAESYLMNRNANDTVYNCLRYPLKELDAYLHIFNVKEKMDSVIRIVDCIEAIYIITLNNDIYGACYKESMTMDEKERMKDYLDQVLQVQQDKAVSGWKICEVGGKNYFIKIMGSAGVYSICVVDLEHISQRMEEEAGDSFMVFAEGGQFLSYEKEMSDMGIQLLPGKTSYVTGTNKEWMVASQHSDYLNCDVLFVNTYRGIWDDDTMPVILTIATTCFVILLISIYRIVRKEFIYPMEQIVCIMEEIAKDGSYTQIEVNSRVREYGKVEETFNYMLQRISELKILAYERLIQMQQTQLQYYQIQIRPHFFLNCMKNLYAMAAVGNNEKLQEMILTMSDYLRSVFTEHPRTIPIQKELENVNSYVKLQQMSCAIRPVLTIEREEELKDFQIPPMSLLTFVENSLQHANESKASYNIHIKVRKLTDEEGEFINITIKDSGSGFEEKVLEKLNHPEERMPTRHIGIYNVRKRFELIYGTSCNFIFSNMNGAYVDIYVPLGEGNRTGEEDDVTKE